MELQEFIVDDGQDIEGGPAIMQLPFTPTETFRAQIEYRRVVALITEENFNEAFPALKNSWQAVHNFSPEEFKTWSDRQITAKVRSQNVSFLGMTLGASHIGQISPFLLFAIFLYFYAHVISYKKHIKGNISKSPKIEYEFFSWICIMENRTGKTLSFLTLIVLPTIVSFLALWRLSGFSPWLCGFFTSFVFAISVCCFIHLSKLRQIMERMQPSLN